MNRVVDKFETWAKSIINIESLNVSRTGEHQLSCT
jgi:hypothetical protein